MINLEGRVIVITGAAGVLGRAVAGRCRVAGASCVLVDRGSDRLPALFAGGEEGERQLLLSGVDLTDPEAAGAMAARTVERFGRIDGLVHTVGGFRGGREAWTEAADTLDYLLDVNLRTAVLACAAVAPLLVEQRQGRIVTIGAAPAISAPAGLAAYAAAKAALVRFTEGLAQDLRPHGVAANCLLPTIIDSPENRVLMPMSDPRLWAAPEAVADTALFLLSNMARAVTGAAIPVPGLGGGAEA